MDKISTGDGHLTFDYTTTTSSRNSEQPPQPASLHADHEDATRTKRDGRGRHFVNDDMEEEHSMVQSKLKQLYQSAHEFGKHQLQVRLDCRPISATMESLFVFPFLSRASLKAIPPLREKYHALLDAMNESPQDSIPLWHDILNDLRQHHHRRSSSSSSSSDEGPRLSSTVICQVLIECDEVFWVKDLSTGAMLQGGWQEEEDIPTITTTTTTATTTTTTTTTTSSSSSSSSKTPFRRVLHLVRFEMVVDVMDAPHRWILPFDMKLGRWQITDIDDHLKGNLLL
jgi:hypothetical protein